MGAYSRVAMLFYLECMLCVPYSSAFSFSSSFSPLRCSSPRHYTAGAHLHVKTYTRPWMSSPTVEPSAPVEASNSSSDVSPKPTPTPTPPPFQGSAVDLLINAGVLSFVLLGIFIKVATVDMDLWRGWYPEEILLRVPRDNWEQYMSMLTAHPVIVKGFTSFSVYALGDVIAQGSEGRQFGAFDRLRLARSALAGLIGHGPLSHFWYEISERAFDFVHLNGMWWSVFPKVAVDQLLWGPIWNGSYIVLLGLMKQNELKRIAQDVYDTSLPLVLSGLKLWPFAHLVTYGLVPIENRLLWVDTVEIMWVMILSRQAASQAKAQDKVEDKAQ